MCLLVLFKQAVPRYRKVRDATYAHLCYAASPELMRKLTIISNQSSFNQTKSNVPRSYTWLTCINCI